MRDLIAGRLQLGRAFWTYAVIYGTGANVLATVAALTAVVHGIPTAAAVGIFLSPLPYYIAAVVGVWRSASRYQGPPHWAACARSAVVVWAVLMVMV